jgi:hypothetical protein
VSHDSCSGLVRLTPLRAPCWRAATNSSTACGLGLQIEQSLVATVHGKRHGIVHVSDAPVATLSTEAGRGAESEIDILAIGLRPGHMLQTVGVGHSVTNSDLKVVRLRIDWAFPRSEPLLQLGGIMGSLRPHP